MRIWLRLLVVLVAGVGLAVVVGVAIRRALYAPDEAACLLVARRGWVSLLGFPAGWALVPVVGSLAAALIGRLVVTGTERARTLLHRWWLIATVAFVALYVPFGPVRVGLLPPECFPA